MSDENCDVVNARREITRLSERLASARKKMYAAAETLLDYRDAVGCVHDRFADNCDVVPREIKKALDNGDRDLSVPVAEAALDFVQCSIRLGALAKSMSSYMRKQNADDKSEDAK